MAYKTPKPKRGEKLKGKSKHTKSVRYAFIVNSAIPPEKIDVNVGGVLVAMLIDLGSSTNVIDRNLWSRLKQRQIKCVSQKSYKKLYAYNVNNLSKC